MNSAATLDPHEVRSDLRTANAARRRSVQSREPVTVIIPTFGRPALARRAIQTALEQTHGQIQVLLVIDGEDAATRRMAAAVNDFRLRVLQLPTKVGAAQARNLGVSRATTEWIAFLDDDDEWLPEKIAAQLEAANTSLALEPVISSRIVVHTGSMDWISPPRPYSSREPMSEYLFCRRNFIDGARYMQTSTLFMRRSLMLTLPFRAELKGHQDWDWLLRAAARPTIRFFMLHEPLAVFNVEPGRESVGRGLGWEHSEKWAREMRHAFTPRAYAFFIANECMSRAVKARAGKAAYARLAREFFSHGRPTPRSLASLAGFLCMPAMLRSRIRQFVRWRRAHTHSGPPFPPSLQV